MVGGITIKALMLYSVQTLFYYGVSEMHIYSRKLYFLKGNFINLIAKWVNMRRDRRASWRVLPVLVG